MKYKYENIYVYMYHLAITNFEIYGENALEIKISLRFVKIYFQKY